LCRWALDTDVLPGGSLEGGRETMTEKAILEVDGDNRGQARGGKVESGGENIVLR